MTKFITQASGKIFGKLRVPGDKSISHRSIMLGSLATGTTTITGFLKGDDALATLRVFQQMGVKIDQPDDNTVVIQGVGVQGLQAAKADLDLGNSGTAMRLLTGLLAGQNFSCTLVGDHSLSGRPMRRVTKPLSEMGALIKTAENNTAPLKLSPSELKPINYHLPMASAQVKSAILLAGIYAKGETCVTEPAPTRDHTERMLNGFGYEVRTQANRICLTGGGQLTATDIDVPADISSAAFFMVAASIVPDSDIMLEHVGVNPTRTGIIDILRLMGADIELSNEKIVGGEPVADIRVRSADLTGIQIPEAFVPLAIDEFPVIFVAAVCAKGQTVLTGAKELRVKESDRIAAMATGLEVLGVKTMPTEDGIMIDGEQEIQGGCVDSLGDHRIAMAFAIAGLRATSAIEILNCENVNTSFPNFALLASQIGCQINQET